MPVMIAVRSLREEHCEFKAKRGCPARPCLSEIKYSYTKDIRPGNNPERGTPRCSGERQHRLQKQVNLSSELTALKEIKNHLDVELRRVTQTGSFIALHFHPCIRFLFYL